MAAERPRRGEVWWVAFPGATGGEVQKTRPVIVISNDAANRNLNRFQGVPLTTRTDRVFPGEALVEIRGAARKAMADQLTTFAIERLQRKHGVLDARDLANVERAVRVQLQL